MLIIKCGSKPKSEYQCRECGRCDIYVSTSLTKEIPVTAVTDDCLRKEFLKRYFAKYRTLTVDSELFRKYRYGVSIHELFRKKNPELGEYEVVIRRDMGDYVICGVVDIVCEDRIIELKTSSLKVSHIRQASIYSAIMEKRAFIYYLNNKAEVYQAVQVPVTDSIKRFEQIKDAWIRQDPSLLPEPFRSSSCLTCPKELQDFCFERRSYDYSKGNTGLH